MASNFSDASALAVASACLRPRGESGVSVCPPNRPSAFPCDWPCRIIMTWVDKDIVSSFEFRVSSFEFIPAPNSEDIVRVTHFKARVWDAFSLETRNSKLETVLGGTRNPEYYLSGHSFVL